MKKVLLLLLFLPLIGFGQVPDLDWVKTFVTPNDSRPLSIKTDNNGFLYVGGFYTGTSDFDPGPGVFNLTAQSNYQNGFIAKYTSSGAFVWARSFDSDYVTHVTSIDIDINSNILIAGLFEGNIDLDPNSGTANYFNSYNRDLFVVKLDSSSNHLWSFTALSTSPQGSVYGSKIKIDNSDNIIITGAFRGATDFDPSSNQYFIYPDYTSDQFIAKYSPQGSLLWATNIGISSDATGIGVSGYNLDIDDNNNIFTTGWFYSTTSLPSGPNYTVANVPVTPNKNNVLTKYDSLGNFLWAQHIISNAACGLKIDNSNNILVQYTGTNMFGNYTNAIIHKKNNDGVSIWDKSYGISLDVYNRFSMDVDSENNIYTTNRYYPYVTHPDFDADPSSTNSYILPKLSSDSYDVFVHCLDSTGSFKWAGNMGSIMNEDFVHDIEIDNNGSVYVSGNYGGIWDFDMSSNTFPQTSIGPLNMWLLKLEGNVTDFPGCTNSLACNYDSEATNEDGSCTYPECYYDCDGGCISDTDSDGVCDELEAPYNPDSDNNQIITITDLLNLFPLFGNSFSATCPEGLQEAAPVFNPDYDDNTIIGLPDFLMVLPLFGQQYIADLCPLCLSGCTDPTAFNYDPLATYEDGSCSYTP
jgi:hypothetical protein